MSIKASIIYTDKQLVELKIEASSDRFKGETNVYAAHDCLANLADAIEGFPESAEDSRSFSLGNLEANHIGGVRFNFGFYERAGHSLVEVELSNGKELSGLSFSETAHFSIAIQAATIDRFVKQLRNQELEVGTEVILAQAT